MMCPKCARQMVQGAFAGKHLTHLCVNCSEVLEETLDLSAILEGPLRGYSQWAEDQAEWDE